MNKVIEGKTVNVFLAISFYLKSSFNIGLDARKPVFGDMRTLKARPLAHLRRLISAFVIHLSMIDTSEISIY